MTTTASTLAAEYDRIRTRRDALQGRRNELASRIATLTTERTAHVVAGRDDAAARSSVDLRALRDDESALADAIAGLDRQLAEVEERQRQAVQREEREAASVAFTEAAARFYAARDALAAKIRRLAAEVAADDAALRAAHVAAGVARERLNRATGETIHWDGGLWTLELRPEREIIDALVHRAKNQPAGVAAA